MTKPQSAGFLFRFYFIVQSLPNAELGTVEQILRHLHAIQFVLQNLNDPLLTDDEINGLLHIAASVINPLEEFLKRPQTANFYGCPPPTFYPEDRFGRPKYNLDLDRAIELHDLGNSWREIARVMRVDRKTLYRHLLAAGLSQGARTYSLIDDDALDQHVSAISATNPLAGSNLVQAHLSTIGIHVPIKRVMESLRRIDAIGVALRWRGVIK